jgi:hypothetical protein
LFQLLTGARASRSAGTTTKYCGKGKATLIKVDLGFIHAFVASVSVIVVSELGDNTFFIAAIMAMQHSRLVVFAGAILQCFL